MNRGAPRSMFDLPIHVTPRSKRDACEGMFGGELRVRLRAPPVEGAANAALLKFMAARLDVPRSSLEMLRGETSRHKCLRIHGRTRAEVETALGFSLPPPPR